MPLCRISEIQIKGVKRENESDEGNVIKRVKSEELVAVDDIKYVPKNDLFHL